MALYVAPQAAGLPTTPYLTVAEFKAAPTDVDTTSLVPGGSQQQQDDALAAVILQASSAMDKFVHYTLGATVDTETRARVRVTRDGYVRVPVKAGIPILEVQTFQVGLVPSQMQSILSGADMWIDDNVIHVPVMAATSLPPRVALFGPGDHVFAQWTHVNGYANTLLASPAVAGATSIVVRSQLGIYPGTYLVIYDSGLTETVQVGSTYVPPATTIPLTSGLLFNHQTVGISVSNLPPVAKKASVLWTTGLIKTRGAAGIVLDRVGEQPSHVSSEEGGGLEDIALAESMLSTLILPTFF